MREYDRDDYAGFKDYWRGMWDCYRVLMASGYIPGEERPPQVGGAGPLAQNSPAESGGEGREDGPDVSQE